MIAAHVRSDVFLSTLAVTQSSLSLENFIARLLILSITYLSVERQPIKSQEPGKCLIEHIQMVAEQIALKCSFSTRLPRSAYRHRLRMHIYRWNLFSQFQQNTLFVYYRNILSVISFQSLSVAKIPLHYVDTIAVATEFLHSHWVVADAELAWNVRT